MLGNKKSSRKNKLTFNSFDGDLNDFRSDDHTSNMIVFESWLNKKGKVNKSWRERYCVLYTDRKLAYFAQQNDKNPKGFILLNGVLRIEMYLPQNNHTKSSSTEFKTDISASIQKHSRSSSVGVKRQSLTGIKNLFGFDLITSKRTWTFSTNNFDELEIWLNNLRLLSFGKPLFKGFLRKQGDKFKTWHKRYFILYDNNELRYFENDTLKKEKGKIVLNECSKISSSKPNQYHFQHCISLTTPSRVWVLAADSSQNRNIWIKSIQSVMKSHQKQFKPSYTGSLSIYNVATFRFIKYYFAAYSDKTENKLCCFQDQIHCKQLEKMVIFGDDQFEIKCKEKIQSIISLKNLQDVISIKSYEFKLVYDKCKDNMDGKTYLFQVRFDNNKQLYFAPHPNTESEVQKWVNIIKNLKSTQRQKIYSKLIKIGYKSEYIAASLDQYESAYGTNTYRVNEIKSMIDRMAKPDTISPSNNSMIKPTVKSPSKDPINTVGGLQPLKEDKSFSIDNINHTNKLHFNYNTGFTSYNKILNDDHAANWSVDDVAIWFKKIENGLIIKHYPNILKNLKNLKVDGKMLKQFNALNLQQLGIVNDLHRSLILEAIAGLINVDDTS